MWFSSVFDAVKYRPWITTIVVVEEKVCVTLHADPVCSLHSPGGAVLTGYRRHSLEVAPANSDCEQY